MNIYSVDRIEENIAVIEYEGKFIEIGLEELPENIKEGDILIKEENGSFSVDENETKRIKALLAEKQNSLFDE